MATKARPRKFKVKVKTVQKQVAAPFSPKGAVLPATKGRKYNDLVRQPKAFRTKKMTGFGKK